MGGKYGKIRSEQASSILKFLQVSGEVTLSGLGYYITQVGRVQRPESHLGYRPLSWRNTANNLKGRGDVRIFRKNGSLRVKVTRQGLQRLESLENISLSPVNKAKWDRKWRFVIFDIPETDRKLRRIFRQRLRDLEFINLQRSVWISPYDSKSEVVKLCLAARFSKKSVLFFLVEHFDGEEKYRHRFHLPDESSR